MLNRIILLMCVAMTGGYSSLAAALELQAGMGKRHLRYQEFLADGSEFNREEGWLNALDVGVSGALYGDFSWTAAFERHWGGVDYDGQSQSGIPSETTTDENFRTLLAGVSWRPENGPWLLHLRYGKADWQRGIREGDVTGELNEDYRWRVMQAAVGWNGTVAGFRGMAEAGYSRKVNGTIEVDFRPYGGRVGTADLADSHGFYLDLALSLWRTRAGDLLLGANYTRESAAQSAVGSAGVIDFVEPESKTRTITYSLSWQAAF